MAMFDDGDGAIGVLVIITVIVIIIICIFNSGYYTANNDNRDEVHKVYLMAVQHNCAKYDPQTGEFMWKEEQSK